MLPCTRARRQAQSRVAGIFAWKRRNTVHPLPLAARQHPPLNCSAPRSKPPGAPHMQPHRASRFSIAALVLLAASFLTMRGAAAATVTVVEFYNATLDHYFISPLQDDIDALDSGRIPGWNRTGYNFTAYGTAAEVAGASPVCRYYIPPQH